MVFESQWVVFLQWSVVAQCCRDGSASPPSGKATLLDEMECPEIVMPIRNLHPKGFL